MTPCGRVAVRVSLNEPRGEAGARGTGPVLGVRLARRGCEVDFESNTPMRCVRGGWAA